MLAPDAIAQMAGAEATASVAPAEAAQGRRVARNIIVVLTSQVAIWVAGSGLGILLPRYLGDTDIGRLTFALSITAFATVVVLFGSDSYLMREVARRPAEAGHLAFNALLMKIPLAAASLAGMILFVNLLHYPAITRDMVYILGAGMCISAVGSTCSSTLSGLERMSLTSLASVIERTIGGVVGVGAVVLAGEGMRPYALILVAASAVSTLIIAVHFARVVGLSWRLDLRIWKELMHGGTPFMLWGIALMIYGSIDITMLSLMTEDEVVGWYGTAYRFIGIATFFPSAITFALLPNISSVGVMESRSLIRRCLDLGMLTSVAITVFFFVGAQAIIDFLRYPAGFQHTVILLQILSLHIPLTTFAMISGAVVIASNREGPRTKAAIAAALVNPLLNLAAIPYFTHHYHDGAIGAAITSVMIEVFMTAVMFSLVPKGVFDRQNAITMLRCAGSGIVMAGAMILVAPYGLIPMFLFGCAAFGVAALALRAVSLRELLDMGQTILRGRAASA
jgi:O-antigen/teichoic acid export membrane protein